MHTNYIETHPGIVLGPEATLREAMETITKNSVGIALITGRDRRLLGILVDSDIRKALLSGATLDLPASKAMNAKPFVARDLLDAERIAALFRKQPRDYIPLVDKAGRLTGLAAMADYLAAPQSQANWVVIMAGGQGMRLRPLTNDRPKPMMRIGEKPILELALLQLVASGLNRFIFSVNYLGDQIQDYFGDGSKWGAQIEYVTEPKRLGTAGALSRIKRDLERSFIVMNADLLTKVNFRTLLDFHENDGNLATMCVREYDFQVPYGVVKLDKNKLAGITEKPVHRFFVNAGIYVLEPEVLRWLKKDTFRDMPNFLEEIHRRKRRKVGCFPVQEYWLDIGKVEDYQRALKEYDQQFQA
jgi:dTDP-glucose pyrophosphorylase/CBS domain-containing protein